MWNNKNSIEDMIIFEDKDILVCHKAAGIAVQNARIGAADMEREGLLKGNLEADYFLFINGKAIGVLEAKREEIDPFSNNVCEQAVLYAKSVPHIYQAYQKPLPFIFTSNGKELFFCDFREQKQSF